MGASKSVLKGGVQKTITLNGVDYQGADMFIINNYPGLGECVVLFQQQNKMGPYLQLPGGRCESKHQSLEDTIYDELYEESKKSICVSKRVFQRMTERGSYVEYDGDLQGKIGKRRCFVAKVPFISEKIFNKNKEIFSKKLKKAFNQRNQIEQDKLRKYMETEHMVRIPLTQLGQIIASGERRYQGVHIATFVLNAYKLYMKMKQQLIFDLRLRTYTQKNNDNIFQDGPFLNIGKIDVYE